MAFRYNKYGVIVSIDFGTTFSGTCYAITRKFTQKQLKNESYVKITHVTDWPNQNRNQHKTPSINIYDRNFHLLYWGREAFDKIKEGEVKDGQKVMEKFKLDLPSSVAQKGAIHQTGNTTNKELMNMRATIDYFREIYDHTVSTIQEDYGSIKGFRIEKDDIRFVITVPAQWNDVQRVIMRSVAKEAGLISDEDHENRLLIINESLAATLYCERKHVDLPTEEALRAAAEEDDPSKRYGNRLEVNDKYMICDAGGGTVDLATFESTDRGKSDENDSFRRCQLTADSGDKCGSVFLDQQMQKLLLNIFFSLEEPKNQQEKDNQKKYENLIAPYMDTFIDGLKLTFGTRIDYKEYEEIFCTHKRDLSDSDSSDDETEEEREEECKQCINDEYKYIEDDRYSDDITFRINGGPIENDLRLNYGKKGVRIIDYQDGTGERMICISYKLMREVVFDKVIESTLDLLKRQIEKANGNIKRTYLVGGFGCSPYLQKRVQKHFTNEKTGECAVGQLVIDTRGNTAAMRGALYYGIDGSRRDPQSDIVENEFKTSTGEFNTLICIDIGYNGTACSYKDLNDSSEDMNDITQWPGLKEENFWVPTALDTSNGQSSWGAQVSQTTNLDPESLIVPSKLMAIVKGDFRIFLSEYLKLLHNHVHSIISQESPHLADKSKYRYVITMENCYQFFNKKSDMRQIAIRAGIISKADPVERLLLIRREDAAAMYYEQKYFVTSDAKAYSNHFVQINMYHDTCHLALHEATKIMGYNQDAFEKDANTKEIETKYFRNVRSMRSATLDFNFINRIVANLDTFVSKNACITCAASKPHDTYNPEYYIGLREGFLEYTKNTLDFSNNDKDQLITITKSGCCVISITVYDLLEHIFRPAIRDLASEINRFATQVDMAQRFPIDKIFLSGILVEALPNTYFFLERILTKNLSETMNIVTEVISPSKDNGKEALLGAAHYGNHPENFTERVSRKSYIVNLKAFAPREFSHLVKEKLAKLKSKNEKYNLEAMNALIDESQEVELYHQLAFNPSRKDNSLKRGSTQATFLIHRGDKITEKDQMHGVSKKFYAERECIVYATIYTSEETDLPEDEVNVDLSRFQKIHQFEIYIKRDADDPMTATPESRLPFDVRIIPDNNEAKFEANVCSRLGKKIPEFRFRDEILVANIYGDEQQIKVHDLTITNNEGPRSAMSSLDSITAAVESVAISS